MEIAECHCISGSESFILRVPASSVSQLDDLIEKLSTFGETKTPIVFSTPVKKIAFEIKNDT
jgi:Lrp/AsnC family transcriptional regulator, leucine-responsive regulatory protein